MAEPLYVITGAITCAIHKINILSNILCSGPAVIAHIGTACKLAPSSSRRSERRVGEDVAAYLAYYSPAANHIRHSSDLPAPQCFTAPPDRRRLPNA